MPLALPTAAYALTGDVVLPAPFLSRALDAVLLPIDDTVRTSFQLYPSDEGVLVLSVMPGGTAARNGILPGDVIYQIRGRRISRPVDVDIVVYYWINLGYYDFWWNVWRDGAIFVPSFPVSADEYYASFDYAAIAAWESWSYATEFSYAEFYAEYATGFISRFEADEAEIAAEAEEYVPEDAEETPPDGVDEATAEELAADGDVDDDGELDSVDSDDDGDGIEDEADTDDDDDGLDDTEEDTTDSDDDGIDDVDDSDDDGDGTADGEDADDDGDGVDDTAEDDADDDNDGVDDEEDADDDNDGIDDSEDADDDGDGLDDSEEAEDDGGDEAEDDGGDEAEDDGGDDGDDGGDE